MEDANLFEQDDCDATAFALANLCAKANKESFDVLPGDICAGWMREDGFKRLVMGSLHDAMVPCDGTGCKQGDF